MWPASGGGLATCSLWPSAGLALYPLLALHGWLAGSNLALPAAIHRRPRRLLWRSFFGFVIESAASGWPSLAPAA